MKNLLFIFMFLTGSSYLFAQTITVNNNDGFTGNGTTTFNNLQEAVTAAPANAVIYIAGSPVSYGNVNIDKPLHLIGAGYHLDPDNGIEQTTILGTIYLLTGSDGSIIEGTYTNKIWAKDNSLTNITIKYNHITGYLYLKLTASTSEGPSGWLIKNNVITSFYGRSAGSGANYIGPIQIINNYIVVIKFINSPDPIIAYNLFQRNGLFLIDVSLLTFTGNIFYTSDISGAVQCSFYNNLVYNPYTSDQLTFSFGDNIADATNIENIDPLFVDAAAGFWEHGFKLQAGSPAKTAGPNSTEIGMYSPEGSVFPDVFGSPSLPKITELKIEDRIIEPGQQLNIHVEAEN